MAQTRDSDFEILTLLLYSGSTDRSLDIRGLMLELNLFEDLFSSTLYGTVAINDSNHIIGASAIGLEKGIEIGITGFDYLIVSVRRTDVEDAIYSKVFRVYKVSDRVRQNPQNETYLLHFCSEEQVLNDQIKMSKVYEETPISDIISDIATTVLRINPKKFNIDNITPTEKLVSVTIPYWRPFYALNWLCARAFSPQYSFAGFLFYENRDGFFFRPLQQMFESAAEAGGYLPQDLFTANIPGFSGVFVVSPRNLDLADDMTTPLNYGEKRAYDYEIRSGYDPLNNIARGMYASSMITVDPLRQRISGLHISQVIDFWNQSQPHLNGYPETAYLQNRREQEAWNEDLSLLRMYPTTFGHDTIAYAQGKTALFPNNVEDWVLQRNMLLANLHSVRMKLTVPFDPNLVIGNTIFVSLPAPAIQLEDSDRRMDAMFTGFYLITAVRHSVNRAGAVTFLELMKESRHFNIPGYVTQSEIVVE